MFGLEGAGTTVPLVSSVAAGDMMGDGSRGYVSLSSSEVTAALQESAKGMKGSYGACWPAVVGRVAMGDGDRKRVVLFGMRRR
jgi:hypothetical protein